MDRSPTPFPTMALHLKLKPRSLLSLRLLSSSASSPPPPPCSDESPPEPEPEPKSQSSSCSPSEKPSVSLDEIRKHLPLYRLRGKVPEPGDKLVRLEEGERKKKKKKKKQGFSSTELNQRLVELRKLDEAQAKSRDDPFAALREDLRNIQNSEESKKRQECMPISSNIGGLAKPTFMPKYPQEQLLEKRLKGYVKATIVAMRYYYKSSDGQRLPNPSPGCFVSLQLEPSNPYHHNAIKVINEADTRHLGYIVWEIAEALAPLLKDKTIISARGIISNPDHSYNSPEGIPCQVLLFFAVPPELVPPLSPYLDFQDLDFHEDLSSPHFMLARTPVAFTGCTLAEYDSYANSISGEKEVAGGGKR